MCFGTVAASYTAFAMLIGAAAFITWFMFSGGAH